MTQAQVIKAGKTNPTRAMVLAAGLGKRMQPLTSVMPKPLIRVAGKALIDYGLDALAAAGVETAIVNVHYLAEQMEQHLSGRKKPRIVISDERRQLLDSGGGIANVIGQFDNKPFYVLNADSFWIEGYTPNLSRMASLWDPERMDILLMLCGTTNAVGYDGMGDFTMDTEGRLERRHEKRVGPFVYAGAAIIDPAIFRDSPEGAFSLNLLFDRALAKGRLFGIRLDGLWLHVGTPDSIELAEQAIAQSAA